MRQVLFFAFLTLLCFVAFVTATHLDQVEFRLGLFNKCYGKIASDRDSLPLPMIRGNGNRQRYGNELFKDGPPSQSVESLISLIEKIEQKHPTLDAGTLAVAILRRYRYDYIPKFELGVSSLHSQYQIEDVLFERQKQESEDIVIEDVLTGEENCSLHYMLSHNFYVKYGDSGSFRSIGAYRSERYPNNSNNNNNNGRNNRNPTGRRLSKRQATQVSQALEYGVGSFRSHKSEAINLNRLLLGVVAGFERAADRNPTVQNLFESLKKFIGSAKTVKWDEVKSKDVKIDPLYAVTFSSVIAQAAEKDTSRKFGIPGSWTNGRCTSQYSLDRTKIPSSPADLSSISGTLAEINGVLDGFAIGQEINEVREANYDLKDVRLSRLLRLYYSRTGIQPVDNTLGYCNRRNAKPRNHEALKEQARGYYTLLYIMAGDRVPDEVMRNVDLVSDDFLTNLRDVDVQADFCQTNRQDSSEPACEATSDLFVMLDLKGGVENQAKITSKIAGLTILGAHSSSMTVLSNTVNGSDQALHRIAWNTTDRGCVNCRLDNPDRGSTFGSPADMLDRINKTIEIFEETKLNATRVPSRPFIIFNGGSITAQGRDNNWDYARERLYAKHRDVNLIVVGGTKEDSGSLLAYYNNYGEGNFVEQSDSSDDRLMSKIENEVCHTPSVFQHPKCAEWKKDDEIVGYVTPRYKQYWAMYPEYFLKSTGTIRFRFTSDGGKIKVCFGREKEPEKSRQCKEQTNYDQTLEFYPPKNPCERRTELTCPPYYFTIYGLDAKAGHICKNEDCQNLRQIKWTFKHEGLSCNSAFLSKSNPLLYIMALAIALFYNSH